MHFVLLTSAFGGINNNCKAQKHKVMSKTQNNHSQTKESD